MAVSETIRPTKSPSPFCCSIWTSAGYLDRVYMNNCTELLPCNWLFVEQMYFMAWLVSSLCTERVSCRGAEHTVAGPKLWCVRGPFYLGFAPSMNWSFWTLLSGPPQAELLSRLIESSLDSHYRLLVVQYVHIYILYSFVTAVIENLHILMALWPLLVNE